MPVLLKVAGRRAVIVGGGETATALATNLLAHGAAVTVVAAAASLQLRALAASGRIALRSRAYVRGDLGGAVLAACFEPGETAAAVSAEAAAERCLVSIADRPELSTVSFADAANAAPRVEERA